MFIALRKLVIITSDNATVICLFDINKKIIKSLSFVVSRLPAEHFISGNCKQIRNPCKLYNFFFILTSEMGKSNISIHVLF